MTNDERAAGDERPLTDQERADLYREQLKALHVVDLVRDMMVTLVTVGYEKLGLTDQTRELRDLRDARVAIEALRRLIEVVEAEGDPDIASLRSTLAQMQLNFARASTEPRPAAESAARSAAEPAPWAAERAPEAAESDAPSAAELAPQAPRALARRRRGNLPRVHHPRLSLVLRSRVKDRLRRAPRSPSRPRSRRPESLPPKRRPRRPRSLPPRSPRQRSRRPARAVAARRRGAAR